ncbi:hypothetical protein [Massilia niabensis]|uniref:Uncharacterized protein n=1 Tax=Massilia niabensis TaxID=544910 RepID=A0ABW0LC33_9BURK
MAEPTTTPGSSQDSTTIGIGGATSGQAGATPSHETQAETGGSGGAQLTHSHGEIQDDGTGKPASPASQAGAPESALQTGARGALDTRPEQGGGTGTGIGSRESGANQSQDDLPPG